MYEVFFWPGANALRLGMECRCGQLLISTFFVYFKECQRLEDTIFFLFLYYYILLFYEY